MADRGGDFLTVVFVAAIAVVTPLSAQSPQTAPAPKAIEVPYTQFTLANGLHVIVHEDHSVPQVLKASCGSGDAPSEAA